MLSRVYYVDEVKIAKKVSKVKGQGHVITECYIDKDTYFDGVTVWCGGLLAFMLKH